MGIGSTKSDIPDLSSWAWDRPISIDQALELYEKGLVKYVDAVNKALKVEVTQEQFDALVSLCYNIGITGLTNSTFMRLINSKAPTEAIVASIKSWNKGTVNKKKVVLPGLVNRRKDDTDVYSKGDYGSTKTTIYYVNPTTHLPSQSKGKIIDLEDYV